MNILDIIGVARHVDTASRKNEKQRTDNKKNEK